MMEPIRITAPLDAETARSLRAGDRVLLSGTVYTARDAAHRRLCELLDAGGEPPFELRGAVIYYCGPAPAAPGRPIGAAGPTSSYRMDVFVPRLMEAGMLGMIGKGPRSADVAGAVQRRGACTSPLPAARARCSPAVWRARSSWPIPSSAPRPCGAWWCATCLSPWRSTPRAATSMSPARRHISTPCAKNEQTFCLAASSLGMGPRN